MWTKSFLDSVARSNRQPLNLLAKKKLLEAKAQLSDLSPYLLQLAEWGLEQGLAPEHPSRSLLESVLQNMSEWEPKRALDYLVQGEYPENPPALSKTDLSGTPEDAAENVLMVLAQRLIEDPRMRQLYVV